MARTKQPSVRGGLHASSGGYKGVRRMGSKYGWEYVDGRTSQKKGGFDSPEEAAYNYDGFLLAYVGPNADTNQALGLLKLKTVLEIRDKIRAAESPFNKISSRKDNIGATGYKGVSANNSKKKPYKAQIYINGKYVHIGTWTTPEEAARAYDLFVIQHIGNKAVTNVSLGLLAPLGEPPLPKVEIQGPPKPPKVSAVKEDMGNMLPDPKPEDDEPFIPPFLRPQTPEEERAAQIAAARAMSDDEDDEAELPCKGEPVSESSNSNVETEKVVSSVMGTSPAPVAISEPAGELLVLSDAERMREQAAKLLRQAAEVEAGDIKRQAAERLDKLSATTANIQSVMMKLIDCCADIETEIQSLRELLR